VIKTTEYICEHPERLDIFLSNEITQTRSQIAQLIKQNSVFIDGKLVPRPGVKLTSGQKVVVNFPEVKSIVGPENIKVVAKTIGKSTRGRGAGRDLKEYIIYISKDLKTALEQVQRGRTSRETEKNKFNLTKKIDAMPNMVRNILKKGTYGAKLSDFGGIQMYPVDWPILGQSVKNPDVFWLSTKQQIEEAVPFKKNALGEQPTYMPHDAEYLEEHDWMTDMNDEVSMARTQLKTIIENATKLMQMSQDGDQYDAWVQAKLTKAADYLQSVYNYQSTEQ
jgi:ribosomal protein S4